MMHTTEMGAATWAELVTSVKVINAVASKTATVNAVWDEVNAMCDKAALEDAHHAVPATALAAALVGRVVGPHLLLSSDKRSQPSWWARMKDRVDALFAYVWGASLYSTHCLHALAWYPPAFLCCPRVVAWRVGVAKDVFASVLIPT